MPQHYTNELIFDLPEQFIDTTHHIFSLTKDGPSEFNMVISQNDIEPDETLQSYGDKLKAELAKSLPNFEPQDFKDMEVADQDALWLAFSWNQQGQKLHQAQANFIYVKEPEKRQLIQITATSLDTFSDEWKQTFETFLASVKLRQEPVTQTGKKDEGV
jgi:hypothetical protein